MRFCSARRGAGDGAQRKPEGKTRTRRRLTKGGPSAEALGGLASTPGPTWNAVMAGNAVMGGTALPGRTDLARPNGVSPFRGGLLADLHHNAGNILLPRAAGTGMPAQKTAFGVSRPNRHETKRASDQRRPFRWQCSFARRLGKWRSGQQPEVVAMPTARRTRSPGAAREAWHGPRPSACPIRAGRSSCYFRRRRARW